MASKNHLLDMQNDDQEIDLQFQDFENNEQKQGQAVYISSFPDSIEDDHEQKAHQTKKLKIEAANESFWDSLEAENLEVKIQPVLSDDLLHPVLVDLVVLKVQNKSNISRAVQEISKNFPIPKLLHLKRVRRVVKDNESYFYIILDYAKNLNITTDPNERKSDNLYLVNNEVYEAILKHLTKSGIDVKLFNGAFLSKVSVNPPRVRALYDQVNKLWPCSFHEDIHLKKLISEEYFSFAEMNIILKYLYEAAKLAETIKCENGFSRVTVLGKDLLCGKGRAFYGKDRRVKNQLLHSSMVAIDAVARSQGGGALPNRYEDALGPLEGSKTEVLGTGIDDGYICTGYDAFLTDEPCLMCSMALLHSRVNRIFYLKANSSKGGVNSVLKLHTLPGINHRYEVFHVLRNRVKNKK